MADALRILVIEDELAIARVLERSFQRRGLEPVIARDGSAAIAALRRERFDFILCDFQLPDMTGEEVCRFARQTPEHRDTPIAFCTAKAYELDVERITTELGLTNIFIKPFSVSTIAECIISAVAEKPSTVGTP